MKTVLKAILLFLIISLNSCKLEKKNQETKPKSDVTKISNSDLFSEEVVIKLKFILEKRDHIQLYFTEDPLDNFSEKQTFRYNTNANSEVQEMIFEFEKDVYPEKLRLDLGANKEQQKIILKNITITKGNKILSIDGEKILKYFTPNPYLTHLEGTGEFIPNIKNNIYDPYLTSNDELNYELAIL